MDVTSETRAINAPRQAIIDTVLDVEQYPSWASDIRSVAVLERDDQGRPVLVHFRAGAFGRSASYTLRYVTSRLPEEVSWYQVDGDVTSRLEGRYRFESIDDTSTQVTYELAAELVVPLPGFLKRRAEMKIVHAALEDLAARVRTLGSREDSSLIGPDSRA